MLYSHRRKVFPKGISIEPKLRNPGTLYSSTRDTDCAFRALLTIDFAFCSFFAGMGITMLLVSNSTPPKLATLPSSFLDIFRDSPSSVHSPAKMLEY